MNVRKRTRASRADARPARATPLVGRAVPPVRKPSLLTVLLGREGQRVNARCVCPSSGVTAVPPLGGVEGGG
jgi:hypothetical protein